MSASCGCSHNLCELHFQRQVCVECVCVCVCMCVWNVWPYLYQESSQLEVQRFPGPQRTTMNLASGLPKRSWLAEFPTSRPADLVPWALPGFPGFPGPPWSHLGPPWLLATDNELICRSLRECQARGQGRGQASLAPKRNKFSKWRKKRRPISVGISRGPDWVCCGAKIVRNYSGASSS